MTMRSLKEVPRGNFQQERIADLKRAARRRKIPRKQTTEGPLEKSNMYEQ